MALALFSEQFCNLLLSQVMPNPITPGNCGERMWEDLVFILQQTSPLTAGSCLHCCPAYTSQLPFARPRDPIFQHFHIFCSYVNHRWSFLCNKSSHWSPLKRDGLRHSRSAQLTLPDYHPKHRGFCFPLLKHTSSHLIVNYTAAVVKITPTQPLPKGITEPALKPSGWPWACNSRGTVQ